MSGTEGDWYFDFPSQNGVHYVYKLAPAMKVGQTITMHFAITGNANFVPTERTATARVRLFLQRRGDTLTAQEPYKRWWSLPYVELREGEFTLGVPLAPDRWTSVFGQSGAEVPTSSTLPYQTLKMLALRLVARSRDMECLSRAGTHALF